MDEAAPELSSPPGQVLITILIQMVFTKVSKEQRVALLGLLKKKRLHQGIELGIRF